MTRLFFFSEYWKRFQIAAENRDLANLFGAMRDLQNLQQTPGILDCLGYGRVTMSFADLCLRTAFWFCHLRP